MTSHRPPAEVGDPDRPRLLIVGLGNPLMGDDGIGHAVAERLPRRGPLRGVRVESLAGDVLGLADVWAGEQDVWLVDAVDSGCPVGSLQVIDHRDLLALPAEGLSIHHQSLGENLRWLLHGRPEMTAIRFRLYGIEISAPRAVLGLSPVTEEAVNRLVVELNAAIRYLGANTL